MMSGSRITLVSVLLSGFLAALALLAFHDVYWWPQDDGVFAYLAELVLDGARYGSEVNDIHGGYHTFWNAFLFHAFGHDVVVLRYPLVVTGVLTAMIAAYLLRFKGFAISTLGGLSTIAFGFLQFPNASATWYLLFFTFVVIFLLSECRRVWWSLALIGILVGISLLFRHPNALLLMFGISAYLLLHAPVRQGVSRINSQLVAFGVGAIFVGVLVYSVLVFEPYGFVLLVLPALVFTFFLLRYRDADARVLLRQHGILFAGIAAAVLPMLIYQFSHGGIIDWFTHSFLLATSITDFDFFSKVTYFGQLTTGITLLFDGYLAAGLSRLFFWSVALVLPFLLLGLFIQNIQTEVSRHPLVPIALIYAPVALYYQIPFYLYGSLVLTIIACLFLLRVQGNWRSVFISFAAVFCVVGFMQSSLIAPYLSGQGTYIESEIPKVSLTLPRGEHDMYLSQLNYIDRTLHDDETMFVMPLNPDLYFTSGQPNAVPALGSGFWLSEAIDGTLTLKSLEQIGSSPALIVFNTESKYVTDAEFLFIAEILASGRYQEDEPIGQMRFFHLLEE